MRLAALLLACAVWTSALADARDRVHGNISVATGYVYRGVSRETHDGAVYGNLEYSVPQGFYAGMWVGRYTPVWLQSADTERNLYLGYAGSLRMDSHFDVSLWRGSYARNTQRDYDWTELNGQFVFRDHWRLLLAVTDNFYGSAQRSVTSELGYTFEDGPASLVIALGQQRFESEYFSNVGYVNARAALNGRNWHLFLDANWTRLQSASAPYSRSWARRTWDVGVAYSF